MVTFVTNSCKTLSVQVHPFKADVNNINKFPISNRIILVAGSIMVTMVISIV